MKNIKLRKYFINISAFLFLSVLFFGPVIVNAQVSANDPFCPQSIKNIGDIFKKAVCMMSQIIVPLLFSVAVVAFIWGIINYFIMGAADEKKRKEGRQFAMWGIIALFIMVSMWGLVRILQNTFGLTDTAPSWKQVIPSGF